MNGIEKEIDKLGRVVIPIEYRRKLKIESNSTVRVSLVGDTVIITSSRRHCALCGECIRDEASVRLCDACVLMVKMS